MRSGSSWPGGCACLIFALVSGCATTTEDLRITYRGKELHKAFLICEDGSSAAAWGHRTAEDAVKGAYEAAAGGGYSNCILEDVDGGTGADFVFQQYLEKPDNKAFLQCSGRVFASWGKASLSDAIKAVKSQAQIGGFSNCSVTNTNGKAAEGAGEDNDGGQRVFERPPDV
jgi:hypothetical protein